MMRSIDFTPQWYVNRLRSARDRKERLIYLAAIGLLMVSWFAVNEGRMAKALANMDNVETNFQETSKLIKELQQEQERKLRLKDLADRFSNVASGLPKTVIFSELSDRIPENEQGEATVRLSEFRLERVGGQNSKSKLEHTLYSNLVAIVKAQALDVDHLYELATRLQESELFELVGEGDIDLREGNPALFVEEFRLYIYAPEYFVHDG